jgi:hypothetical protein
MCTCVYIYIYIYIFVVVCVNASVYVFVCACVCVCVLRTHASWYVVQVNRGRYMVKEMIALIQLKKV